MNHPISASAPPTQGRGAGDRRRTGDARQRARHRRDRLLQRLRHHGDGAPARAAPCSTSASCRTESTRPPPPSAARARPGADILVTSGGASVGDYDLVQQALAAEGLALSFWKVALRPGRPMMHGRLGPMHVLGLPGNPVSSYVCAVLFLVPLIRRLAGRMDVEPEIESASARLRPAAERRAGRLSARHADRRATRARSRFPFRQQDSSMLVAARKSRLPADPRTPRPRGPGR